MRKNKKRLLIILCSFAILSFALTISRSINLKGEEPNEPDEQINPIETTETEAPLKVALDDTTNFIQATVKPNKRVKQTSVLYVKGKVNLRKSPNVKSKVLAKIPAGTYFEAIKKGEKWTKITYQNKVRYASSSLLHEAKLSMADGIVIVNKGLPLPRGFDPGYNQESLNQMNKLLKEAKLNGYDIHIVSSYRSFNQQKKAYKNNVKNDGRKRAELTSARPGYSEHQTGMAYDVAKKGSYKLVPKFGDSNEGKWMAENAPRYGFILRYPDGKENVTGYLYEPWHFRYVGEIAEEITKSGLTLDEYFHAINPNYYEGGKETGVENN